MWTDKKSFIPLHPKVEMHITYKCSLACLSCSRACFLQEPYVEDMTFEDLDEFKRQADEIGWNVKHILITGGEPTLHPKFLEMVKKIRDWQQDDRSKCVQIFSNHYTEKTQQLLNKANKEYDAAIFLGGKKTKSRVGTEKGEIEEWSSTVFVSPKDAGMEFTGPCFSHSAVVCGVGVNHNGYSICPLGMGIVKLLGIKGTTTKNLVDLFDEEKAKAMTLLQCEHCGFMHYKRECLPKGKRDEFWEYANKCEKIYGMSVSPTWKKVFTNRKLKEMCKEWIK